MMDATRSTMPKWITVGVLNPAIPSAFDLPDIRSAASATTTNIKPVSAAPEEPVMT
jgi:hypothetical protein